ncbi:MAG TPA: AraC family transcriptional regulator [Casimicrobiaceae bacterium]|nr:AraC family transcriptional regulator [Casimicrobiaceae bacterium]
MSGSALAAGRYYGAVGGRLATSLAVASEVIHAGSRALPEHDHALAYFCMLTDGRYVETIGGRDFDYAPFEVGFHPARMPHRDAVGARGARFLCLEIHAPALDEAQVRLRASPALLPGDVTVQLVRVYGAMIGGTLSPIVLDSAVWALCGDVSDARACTERAAPRWLARCLDLIEAAYGDSLTVGGIAREVGVHPVHLAREFRRRYGQTLGEYVHKVRVRAACARMLHEDEPLATIAASAGFADQSHFCRVFKQLVGQTPSQFRAGARR